MQKRTLSNRYAVQRAVCGALAMAALSGVPAMAEGAIDEDADVILHAMSDRLRATRGFSVDYNADQETVDHQGQKLQYSASGTLTVARDSGFLATRKGPFADVELRFDGKLLSLFGKGLNVYAQIDSPGPSIEAAIEEFRMSTGLDVAGADLISADPYAVLTENVVTGELVGTAYVGGIECDHLAFRNDDVDWQIWISTGEQKLPIKYVITTKWLTGAPQYALHLTNWKMGDVDPGLFAFTPPAGAKKLDQFYSDAVGDLTLEGGE